MRIVPVVALLGSIVLLAACGGNAYDDATVERFLRSSQAGKVGGLPLGAATCPEDVELSEGVTFECTLRIDGVAAPYTVTLRNVEADKVRVEVEPAKAIIPPASVERYVRSMLDVRESAGLDVTCGDERLFVVDPGTRIGYIVTVDGEQRQVSLVVKNTQGLVQIER